MGKRLTLTCVVLVLMSPVTLARPVSYGGGTTLMQLNDADTSAVHVHYSPTYRYSLGYRGEYRRTANWQFNGLQANFLLKRKNKIASQANLYFKSAIGFAKAHSDEISARESLAGFVGFSADWENRRFFAAYENRYYDIDDIDDFYMQSLRLGLAPYVANYGKLHTWLMLHLQHEPEADDEFVEIPVLRFFRHDYLIEVGYRDSDNFLFNFIVRF